MADENLTPEGFRQEIVKNAMQVYISDELLADSWIPDVGLFLLDPDEYRRRHPYVPPTRKQRLKTWIGARREKLGERLYTLVAGIPFPDDQW